MKTADIFNNLCLKIEQLQSGRTEVDRNIISNTLDGLNSLNYLDSVVKNPTKAVLLVNQLCNYVPPDDGPLIAKCCKFVVNVIKLQNVNIEGRTLTVSVQWGLRALRANDGEVAGDILAALESLARSAAPNTSLIDGVIREVSAFLHHQGTPRERVSLAALECLGACVLALDDRSSSNYRRCADVFCRHLSDATKSLDFEVAEVCLTGLRDVIARHPDYLRDDLGLVLGIAKSYMVFGLKDVGFVEPARLLPSGFSVPEISTTAAREKKGGKVTKQRKHRASVDKKERKLDGQPGAYRPANVSLRHDVDQGARTSDSDVSDCEGGRFANFSRRNAQIRCAALSLLYHAVGRTDKPVMFSYWACLMNGGPHTLTMCILKDPSGKCRIAALNVLLQLLNMAKAYLCHAEYSARGGSFTPYSVALGVTLSDLHRTLNLALSDVSVPVLTQALKCVAALVQSTPYHKMAPGMIAKLARNVRAHVYHKDTSVQVLALIVMGCVLTSEPTIPETLRVVVRGVDSRHTDVGVDGIVVDADAFEFAEFSDDDGDVEEGGTTPWLLKRCLANLEADEQVVPAPVKLESLQVISAMTQNYFAQLTAPHLAAIAAVLAKALADKYGDIRLHAGRTVDFIGQAMQRVDPEPNFGAVERRLQFWEPLLAGPLISLLQDETHANLRAVGCDCLGSVGPLVFNHLPRSRQILCVTVLFACAKDEDGTVKGAAVRALAICVLYPSLRSDPGFVEDTAAVIHQALTDDNLTVKIKASWSLGNLSDALVLNSKSDDGAETLPDVLLLKLLEVGVRCASDNEKIRTNVVRAIGNLLQLVDARLALRADFRGACERALTSLVKNCSSGSNSKVRWNACYALGNALKNRALYDVLDGAACRPTVFATLTDLVVGFKNFKVRINAAVALASPPERAHYGPFYVSVWASMLKALENSQNMDDFSEYKHRDHLIEQLCIGLAHLTVVLTVDDLVALEELLRLYLEVFKGHARRVLDRLVPEKSSELFSASCYLDNLRTTGNLTDAQKRVLKDLLDVFRTEF
ncbi:HEAT repeat-containing protein 6 [Cylas formicarius]|uniref:HEAT repeat-containing protein 6 n=1 Tax=Cylas formicarius TaxID=197179 RepID=UPI00295834B3|nr:HEAT repeat-containing protein 6 [Cylas formicarius]